METITFIPNNNRIKLSGRRNKFNSKAYSLIRNINFILETIIKNTLKFNKLTSVEEIYEGMDYLQNERHLEIESYNDIDIKTIKNICEALCTNSSVLIKLEKEGKKYYKLNYNESI